MTNRTLRQTTSFADFPLRKAKRAKRQDQFFAFHCALRPEKNGWSLIQMYLKTNTHVGEEEPTIQYMSNLGETIVKARTAKGWSQEELAKRSGVSQGTIGHLESGRNSTSRKLPDIARALGLSVEELVAGRASTGQAVLGRAEPPSWPFKVSIDRVAALPAGKLERIEGFIVAVLQEHEATLQKRHA